MEQENRPGGIGGELPGAGEDSGRLMGEHAGLRGPILRLESVLRRLRSENRPVRFLISRLLRRSGLCNLVPLWARLGDGSRVRFRNSAVAANLWVDPSCFDGTDIAFLRAFLRPGDTFVDVGANVGVYSLYGARSVGPTGRVFAVEPHPRIWRQLRDNLRANEYSWAEAFLGAVSDTSGARQFTDMRSDDQNGLKPDGPLSVRTARLDDLIPHKDVRLLKIDVEGHEAAVLAGAVEVLRRTDAVLVEAWEATRAEVEAALSEFEITVISEGRGPANLLAVKRFA